MTTLNQLVATARQEDLRRAANDDSLARAARGRPATVVGLSRARIAVLRLRLSGTRRDSSSKTVQKPGAPTTR